VDIVEYAMQMEKDGEAYYRALAGKTDSKGMKRIFDMLANAEMKHYEAFRRLKDNKPQPLPIIDDKFLLDIKNIFQEICDSENWQDLSGDQADAYRQARDLEKESMEFYLEQAEELSDPMQQELCRVIAGEERTHYRIIDNILELVSRPKEWLENAEWRHLDEY
jgi:rubrerythrin